MHKIRKSRRRSNCMEKEKWRNFKNSINPAFLGRLIRVNYRWTRNEILQILFIQKKIIIGQFRLEKDANTPKSTNVMSSVKSFFCLGQPESQPIAKSNVYLSFRKLFCPFKLKIEMSQTPTAHRMCNNFYSLKLLTVASSVNRRTQKPNLNLTVSCVLHMCCLFSWRLGSILLINSLGWTLFEKMSFS